MKGTSWARHLAWGVSLLRAVCRPHSQTGSAKPILVWSSGNLIYLEVWGDGLKHLPAQLLGFVKEIMQHPIFLEKKALLRKHYIYKWEKDWKDLYQNTNSDFSGWYDLEALLIFFSFYYAVHMYFVSRSEYI